MKNLLIIAFVLISSISFAQGVNVRWQDRDGRQFSVNAPSGAFRYSMISGDVLSYGVGGKLQYIGPVSLSYGVGGKLQYVDSVNLSYDLQGRISYIGGLSIQYDLGGRVVGTRGSVN